MLKTTDKNQFSWLGFQQYIPCICYKLEILREKLISMALILWPMKSMKIVQVYWEI